MTDCSAVAEFDRTAIRVGRLLGSGGFCEVYSVKLHVDIDIKQRRGKQRNLDTLVDGHFDWEDEIFAIKTIKASTSKCPAEEELAAAGDLLNEVTILSNLPHHPNVNLIRGVSAGFFENPLEGWVVLDRLVESLDKTLRKWRKEAHSGQMWFALRKHLSRQSQAKRIEQAMVGVASAMEHLHKHEIIFRDLKPGNLAFSMDGQIRLIDFGLARKLGPDVESDPDFRLTLRTGTLRYMAPEVAACEDYSYTADVHSFGMVLWEVCMLDKPFREATTKEALDLMVTRKDHSPFLRRISSCTVKALLQNCWAANPMKRPRFVEIVEILRCEVKIAATAAMGNNKKEISLATTQRWNISQPNVPVH